MIIILVALVTFWGVYGSLEISAFRRDLEDVRLRLDKIEAWLDAHGRTDP